MPKVHVALAMAMTRQQFEGKLDEFIGGALGEYMLSKVVGAMGWPENRYRGKWMREAKRLIEIELVAFMKSQTTKQSFNRMTLFEKVLDEHTPGQKAKAFHHIPSSSYLKGIAKDYGLPEKISKRDLKFKDWLVDFHEYVLNAVEVGMGK